MSDERTQNRVMEAIANTLATMFMGLVTSLAFIASVGFPILVLVLVYHLLLWLFPGLAG